MGVRKVPKDMIYSPQAIKANLDGRTLKWLAGKSGINVNRLYRLAKGDQEPTASEVIAISQALGMEPAELLGAAA